MRLFFVLVCCLAIPLVARAADQDNNQANKKKEKQTTQSRQPQQQTGKQGAAVGTRANTASQLNSPAHLKGQGQPHAVNAQNNNVPAVQSHTRGMRGTRPPVANTASQLNSPAHLKGQGQPHAVNAQNNNVPAVQSHTRGMRGTRPPVANTASQLNNPAHLKGQRQPHAVNAQNNNVPAVQSHTRGKLEARHFNLANTPNPRIQSMKFQQNYHIQGSENWQGRRYGAFQNYRGEWHDQGWWHNHYNRIVLISGGWYFWNAGYWYPAWGYEPAVAYYPYNGPIYAYNNLPPDQVISNVQSALQAEGYYQGEVDGLLGPETRAALANYQQAHGLYTTEAIDEPTLESLGMS